MVLFKIRIDCCLKLQVASLVAVLKVARQLNLVRDLERVALPGHEPVQIPEALLQRAIEHGNEPLLVDAMALVCSHPKSTAVPGAAQATPPLHMPLPTCLSRAWPCGSASKRCLQEPAILCISAPVSSQTVLDIK